MESKKKNISQSNLDVRFIQVIAGIVILAVAVFGAIKINDIDERAYRNTVGINYVDAGLSQEVEMLKFCITNGIKDCTKENIQTWNEQHPANKFNIKTEKELLESSIPIK